MSPARGIGSTLLVILVAHGVTACSSGTNANAESFCTAYIDAARTGADLRDPSATSLVDYRRQLDATERQVTDAARHAPRDISSQVKELTKPLHTFRIAIDRARTDAEVTAAVKAYAGAQDALTETRKSVDSWTATHCGVVPVTTAPPTSVTPSTGP